MPKNKKFGLKSKIIAAITLIIFFFGSIATIATFQLNRNSLITQTLNDLAVNNHIQSHEVYQIMRQSRDLVNLLSKRPEIISFVKDVSDQAKKRSAQTEVLNSYNLGAMYSSIYIIDKDGYAVLSTDPQFEGQNYSFREYFKEGMKGNTFVDTSIGVSTNELGYYFSSPIFDSEQTVIGVAVVKLKQQFVAEALSRHATSALNLSIFDKYGIFIYSTDPKKLYHSLGPLSEDLQSHLKETKRFGTVEIHPHSYEPIYNDLANLSPTPKTYQFHDSSDNEEELISVTQIDEFPFYIFFEAETDKIAQASINSAIVIASLVLLAALIAAVLISIIISRFLSPITKLQHYSELISAGKFDEDLKIESNDELETLATTLNNMAANIRSSQQKTEEEVKLRTAELANLNKLMVGRELKMVELKTEIERLKNTQK